MPPPRSNLEYVRYTTPAVVVLDGYVARAAEPDGHAAVEVVVAGALVVLVASVDEGRADELALLILLVLLLVALVLVVVEGLAIVEEVVCTDDVVGVF